jgi:predicted PurR-regulated permease PerM
LSSLGAAHAQRQTYHDFYDRIVGDNLSQALEIQAFILAMDGFEALGRDAKGIGNGNANALRSDIQAKNSRMRNWGVRIWRHVAIIRRQKSETPLGYGRRAMEKEGELEVTALPVRVEPEPVRRHWALNIIGIAGILALCDYGETVLVVMLVAVLLAFILAPVADLLTRFHLPRSLAALVTILLFLAAIAGVSYYSYNQAATLFQDLPKYMSTLREEVMNLRAKAESLEGLPTTPEPGILDVRNNGDWTEFLKNTFGSATTAFLAASFVPFLVYFMLTWQQHVRSATVMLFPMEYRHTAYVTLGLISAMIRSFMVGNLLIGVSIGLVSMIVFGIVGVPFFYFVGFMSGFLSLVPYMGVLLALVPPIFVSLGHLHAQEFLVIALTVFALHLVALNILYPKFLGKRLQLNPLAVAMALLLWGFLWGAMGLLLAIPITAAMKIVFDHVTSLKPYGDWLGE